MGKVVFLITTVCEELLNCSWASVEYLGPNFGDTISPEVNPGSLVPTRVKVKGSKL